MAKNNFRVKINKFTDTALINDDTFFDYLYRFKKIALSIFEWQNLPNSMNSMFLEKCLYYTGTAALLKDKDLGFINTKAVAYGRLNIYDLPTEINCYSFEYNEVRRNYTGLLKNANDEVINKDTEECILVQNTWDRTPTAPSLELYAMRLYEVQRAIDTNVKAQKTPVIIITDDKQRLTMENLYNQYEGNKPFIFGDKNLFSGGSPIKALNTEAPFVVDKLQKYKQEIFNEALTFLGINNIATEKRERLNEEEAIENNELINMNLQSYLAPRQYACKLFNEKFGLTGTDKEIKVKVRSDLHNIIKEMESTINDYKEDFNEEDDLGGNKNE